MFGCRGLVVFLIAGYLLLAFDGYYAQGEDSDSDNEDSDSGYTKTYRTGIEKVLQGILNNLPSGSSNGIGRIISDLPKPLKTIISGAANVTKRTFSDILDMFEEDFHAIFPGTLWCGAGNISSSEDDVGTFKYTDECCRGHDNCPSAINAGETKGDLVNDGIFTRSACSCDHDFYNCLKNASTLLADKLGFTYFTILRPQCFEENYPIASCAEYAPGRIVEKKCEKYNFNTTQSERLIWVDNPDF